LIFTILAISLTLIQSMYINRNSKIYNCFSNNVRYIYFFNLGIYEYNIRYYIDMVFYSYILINILMFFLVKGVYLLGAWVCCPGLYLRLKKIID